jgi:hypothetical protein
MALTKVSGGLIADNSVGLSQLDGGTDGNLITYDASGNPSHVPTGSANQALASNGAGAAPTFQNLHALLPSGSVLEELALLQNGSSQTVGSGTYTAGNVTAAQDLTTTYADVTGSSINYTPPSGATRVVYSLIFHASYSSAATTIGHFRLYLDSDEVTEARTTLGGDYKGGVHAISWVFQIGGSASTAIGQVASWSSAKLIKMQARLSSTDYQQRLHQTYNFDGTTQANDHPPIVNVRAIK